MRAPRRRRPRTSTQLTPDDPGQLADLAARVSYTPSAEHKDYKTSAGPGKLRSDASACPRDLALDEVAKWLRDAVRAGNVCAYIENDFPRYVWTRTGDRVYEARLCNSGSGEYKGYPILPDEAPRWLQ